MIAKRMEKGSVVSFKEAFTMIEMLIVIALIGVIFAFVGPRVMRMMRQRGEAQVKLKMINITDALTEFKLSNDRYPNQKEGLSVLGLDSDATEDFEYNAPPRRYTKQFKKYELIYQGDESETPMIGGDGKVLKPADAKALGE